MIRQYLPQTNENATVAKSKIFSHLNKALLSVRLNGSQIVNLGRIIDY